MDRLENAASLQQIRGLFKVFGGIDCASKACEGSREFVV